MGSPVPQGYADWTRLTPQSDQVFVSDVANGSAVAVPYGPFYVGNVRALYMKIDVQNVAQQLMMDWRSTPSPASTVSNQFLAMGANTSLSRSIRPHTPWVVFTMNATGIAGGVFTFLVTAIADVQAPILSTGNVVMISKSAQAIGATTTVLNASSLSHFGQAYFNSYVTTATWRVQLESVDDVGVSTVLAAHDNFFGRMSTMVYLPGGLIRVRTNNTAAAAGSYDAFLVLNPRMDE